MSEPMLFGSPITTVFLYFVFYSFFGWALETLYCSFLEKRFVARGFLLSPICPIYGVGALMMIFLISPYANHPVIFYLLATVVMSAWEYLVGWFLEVTTHIKYWDYSSHKFNISGRISLFICLWWGVLAYISVFYIHPEVEQMFAFFPAGLRYTLAGSIGTLLVVDTATTIHKLALIARVMTKLEDVSGEIRLQAALGKAELGERFETAVDNLPPELRARLGEARGNLDDMVDHLRDRRNDLIEQAERYSRRFRRRYSHITSKRFDFSDVKAAGERIKGMFKKATNEHETIDTTEK